MSKILDESGNVIGTIVEAGSGCGPEFALGVLAVVVLGLVKLISFLDKLPEAIHWVLTILFVIWILFKFYHGLREENLVSIAIFGSMLTIIILMAYIAITACPLCFHL